MPYHLEPFLVNEEVLVYSLQDVQESSFTYNAGSLELLPNLRIQGFSRIDGYVTDSFGVHPVVLQYERGNLEIVYAPNDSEFVYSSDGQPVKHDGIMVTGKSLINMPDLDISKIGSNKLVSISLQMPNEASIEQFIKLSHHNIEQDTDQSYAIYQQAHSSVVLPSSQTVLPAKGSVQINPPTPSLVQPLGQGINTGYRQTPSLVQTTSRSVIDHGQNYTLPPTPQRTPQRLSTVRPPPTPVQSSRTKIQGARTPSQRPREALLPRAIQPQNPAVANDSVVVANAALAQTLNMAASTNPNTLTMDIESEPPLPQITVDMTQIIQSTPSRPSQPTAEKVAPIEIMVEQSSTQRENARLDQSLQSDEGPESDEESNLSKRSELGEVRSPSPRAQSRPSPNPSPSPSSENPEIKELRREINELREILVALTRRYYQIYPVTIPSEIRINGKVGTFISVTEAKQKSDKGEFVEFILDPLLQPFVASNRKTSINRLLGFKSKDGSLYLVRASYDPKTNEFNEPV